MEGVITMHPQSSQQNEKHPAISPEGADVLIIEDDPNDAELELMAFRKSHLDEKIAIMKDGAEAMEFISSVIHPFTDRSSLHIKLVILDLKLPKVDGLEILRQIKTNEILKTIPVVVLTSSAEERDIVEAYKRGANSYVVKPVEFDKFIETIGKVSTFWLEFNEAPLRTVYGGHDVAA
jgi:two-component system, response regulator